MGFWKWLTEFNEEEFMLKCLLFIGINSAISSTWAVLEAALCGSVQRSLPDAIICIAFTWTAYKLLRKRWKINWK